MAADDLLLEVSGGLARVTLNRPQALNALTLEMAKALDSALVRWEADDAVRAVVVRGAGERAFSAGGDIRALYESGTTKANTLTRDFYWREYRLNRRIKRFPKPYVALMDGVAMGGGVGVSVHGSHRVATERTLFAMPETGIGLFPDVGGSHFLPRCPGKIGLYLALTGTRIGAADCLYAGITTHHVPSAGLGALVDSMAQGAVDAALAAFHEDPGPASLAANRAAIDRCFGQGSVEAIAAALESEGGEWAAKARAAMAEKSPFLQKVAFAQLSRGASLSFEDAMVMEFRLVQRAMAFHEFYEGVRAAVIDKDRTPKWRPATLAEVDAADVEAWFAPLPDGDLVFA
ncbi:MAG: enoyl-CoA hydratase/isomerase family protein [Alphaproteobacteria bacterium]|nr:enoyl-CoA hydratase/isomerase family protein [Alphaproteobacteria bacterium]